nr:MAG TPA: hypothetical protein [Caudoviricetes sp.]DAZ50434.1 MAG TPA: hypothetical protein [Caudoviricetes sp.]
MQVTFIGICSKNRNPLKCWDTLKATAPQRKSEQL